MDKISLDAILYGVHMLWCTANICLHYRSISKTSQMHAFLILFCLFVLSGYMLQTLS